MGHTCIPRCGVAFAVVRVCYTFGFVDNLTVEGKGTEAVTCLTFIARPLPTLLSKTKQ